MSAFSAILNRGDWAFNVLRGAHHLLLVLLHVGHVQSRRRCGQPEEATGEHPGIRPGRHTAEYIDRVVTRITVGGSIYLAAICIIPSMVSQVFHVPFQFGGTSLIIVVGVALETTNQIEAHLITRSYEGLTGPQTTRLSGRRPA
jgi:preprotein translocase subunit SecY